MGRGWMSFEGHARNVDVKHNSGESQKEMRNSLLEIGEKMVFNSKVSNNLAVLCANVLWNTL